jgi:hypothetical protein
VPIDKTIDCYLIEQPGVLKVMRTAEDHVAELAVEEIALVRKVEEAEARGFAFRPLLLGW